jgi:hypothetical protein
MPCSGNDFAQPGLELRAQVLLQLIAGVDGPSCTACHVLHEDCKCRQWKLRKHECILCIAAQRGLTGERCILHL